MDNYRAKLLEQRDALTTDIAEIQDKIITAELEMEKLKDAKSAALRELRIIEKRLEKIKG